MPILSFASRQLLHVIQQLALIREQRRFSDDLNECPEVHHGFLALFSAAFTRRAFVASL